MLGKVRAGLSYTVKGLNLLRLLQKQRSRTDYTLKLNSGIARRTLYRAIHFIIGVCVGGGMCVCSSKLIFFPVPEKGADCIKIPLRNIL